MQQRGNKMSAHAFIQQDTLFKVSLRIDDARIDRLIHLMINGVLSFCS